MPRLHALALLLASPALAQSLHGLGNLNPTYSYSEGFGVSGNGSVAVGGSVVAGSGFNQLFAAFASGDSGTFPIYDNTPNGVSGHALAASFSGDTIVGYADHGAFSPDGIQAFVWTAANGPVEIGDLPGGANGVPHSYARAVSADGSLVACIGQSDNGDESFLYNVATGAMTPVGDLPGGTFGSYAYGMSRDGTTIVGVSYSTPGQQAFRWTQGGGIVSLGFLPTLPTQSLFSSAEAANQDGSVIVGESSSQNTGGNGYEAFRWTQAGGMQPLGDLPGAAFQSWAYAVSADGNIVVGRGSVPGNCGPFGCGSAGHAFIWDATNGMRDLQDVLTSHGVPLNGWVLTEARAISADGTVIVGNGTNPQGNFEGWIVTLGPPPPPPPHCGSADFNCDGDVGTDQDIDSFFACLAGLCPSAPCPNSADFNADGDVGTDADIEAFFRVLAGGTC
jgi:probable HAF family extracellular repeat protein